MLGQYTRTKWATASTQIFTESVEWSNSVEQNGYVYGKPDDLNTVYFQIRWIWNRVYRASKCEFAVTEYLYSYLWSISWPTC
jgi:hypothetical protein